MSACSGRPSAARSTSAWKPWMTPRSRSARRRARAVEGATPTASASAWFVIRASAARISMIARSVESISVGRCFGTEPSWWLVGADYRGSGTNSRRICDQLTIPRISTRLSVMEAQTRPATVIRDSILDAIGDTPLVRLSRIAAGVRPQVVAKVESLNPGGSIKDRVAVALIEAAERDGSLRPGGTIVEPTSGNTGTGLAIAARLKGYRVIAVMPDKMSREKIDLLRAYGAEVVIAPTDVAPESPQSYYRVADRLTEEIPGAFQPNQYHNPANPQTHYETTGPEIWRQTAGRVTHLVAGVGTGGTISGIARYLREQNPDVTVVGADPVG